jgi:hypothetical protein
MTMEQRTAMREDYQKRGLLRPSELDDYLHDDTPDPLLLAIIRLCEEHDRRKQLESANAETPDNQDLPPGTIQACQTRSFQ